MTLRRKTLIIVSVTTFSLILVLYVASQTVLLGSFTKLEKQFASQNIERAVRALSNEIAVLDATVSNVAAWDATYAFIQSPSNEYTRANFTDETAATLRINLVLLIDNDAQIVFGRAFDLHNERQVPVPGSLRVHLAKDALLLRHTDVESSVAGIVLLPEGPMLIASRPVLTSKREGPIRGTLVMGRYLDSVEVERLAETTHLSLTLRRFDDSQMPSDFRVARSSLSKQAPVFVRALGIEFIAGYGLLENIYGEPCLILRADAPSEVYSQGRTSALYFISALVVVSLVFGLMTLLLLEIVILSRLSQLSTDVSRIGTNSDLSARVSVMGGDELSSLAGTINEMLTALEQSQDALRESEERYRLLFNSGSDMMFVSELTGKGIPGKLIAVNDIACQRLGHTREEMLRLWFLDLTASEDWDDFPALAERLLAEKQVLYEAVSVARDGTRIPIEFSAHVFDLGGQPAVLSIARDISERKQAEEALELHNRELTTLYEAATAISSDLSLDVVLQTVAEQATRALDSSGCALSLWRREENLVETLVDYSVTWPDETEPAGTTYDLAEYPVARRVLETGQPVVIQHDDPTVDEAELVLMRQWEVLAKLMLPLVARDRVLGLVELIEDVKARDYTPEEIRLAESLVAHAAVAIENARLYGQAQQEIAERKQAEEALRKSEQRFRDVAHTTGDWIWEMDSEGRYTYASPVVEQVLGYTPTEVMGRHYYDFSHPNKRQELKALVQGIFGKTGAFVGLDNSYVHKGGHEVVLETSGLQLTDAEGNLLGYRGAHRDITVERQMQERLTAVHALGRELVLSMDEQQIAEIVIDAARLLLHCQLCSLWLVDQEERVLVRRAVKATEQERVADITAMPLDGERGVMVAVVQTGEPIYVPDVRDDLHYIDSGIESRSELCVPLKVGERVIGVLNTESTKLDTFDQGEQQLFLTLADQTALAIENARLYEQMRIGHDRLQALSHRLVEVQETERRRLARELHDEIGQVLTGLKLILGMSKRLSADEVEASLGEAQELVDELMTQVRDLSLDLRPTMLDDLGLLPALLWHFERYTSQTDVHIDLGHTGLERQRFAPEIETAAYRIVQEALTNVARHAGVREVTVRLWADQDMLGIQIKDQGIGFDLEAALDAGTTGGLTGMYERAVLLGGQLTIESAPETGTRLTAEFPLAVNLSTSLMTSPADLPAVSVAALTVEPLSELAE